MLWYYKLLAHRPHLILLFIGTLCVACIVVSLTTKRLPDFSDPTLGFEARGTKLGQRMTAWHNLLEETSPSGGKLIANPYEYLDELEGEEDDSRRNKKPRKHNNAQRHRKRKKGKNKGSLVLTEKIQVIKSAASGKPNGNAIDEEEGGGTAAVWVENGTRREDAEAWEYGRNVSFIDDDDEVQNKSNQAKKENWAKLQLNQPPPFQTDIHTSSDGFFCESPSRLSFKINFKRKQNSKYQFFTCVLLQTTATRIS